MMNESIRQVNVGLLQHIDDTPFHELCCKTDINTLQQTSDQ